jgi:hypothetical protein
LFFDIAFGAAGETIDKPATRPPIPPRQRDSDSDSESRLEPGPGEAGDDALEARGLTKQQMHLHHQQQKNQPQMQQQISEQRAEKAQEGEGRERQSHVRGFGRIASADSSTSFTRTGSAFSTVKSGGLERTRSSGSDSKSETMVCILNIASV